MRASMLVGVFWRGEELAAGRGVMRETKTRPEVSPRSRYKFMTWWWFCVGCFSVQLLPNLSTSRDFDLSARESELQKSTFCPHGYTLIYCGCSPFRTALRLDHRDHRALVPLGTRRAPTTPLLKRLASRRSPSSTTPPLRGASHSSTST